MMLPVGTVRAQSTGRHTALWYRGTPAGVPRSADLALVRSVGFGSVVWPRNLSGFAELETLAARLGLGVFGGGEPAHLTASTALNPPERVDLDVSTPGAEAAAAALAWRALAHGARVLAFDPGVDQGTGMEAERRRPGWIATAETLSRQLRVNAPLFDTLEPGPTVAVEAVLPGAVDVALRQTPRSWVIIATNCGEEPARGTARFPSDVPPALWTSLIDGTGLSMLNSPNGPSWSFSLEPGGVLVYLIQKGAR
jgi:hypothetical protein